MYSNDDLNRGVEQGIFTQKSVDEFRVFIAEEKDTTLVDEESFKLFSGFNDIFVVIALLLLLISLGWIGSIVNSHFSAFVVALASWGLSEVFIRQRKMAFPAIILLLAFVISSFRVVWEPSAYIDENGSRELFSILASLTAVFATYMHWRRFKVPITMAVSMGAVIVFIISIVTSLTIVSLKTYLAPLIFLMGIVTFVFAMYWDVKDRKRVSNESDVAFWLHLLASPLIIHSIFLGLGIFENHIGTMALLAVVLSYIILSVISLVIDRRALMVSSLVYVLYALNTLFTQYGLKGYGLAIGGVIIGFGLLFLTAYWSKVRGYIVIRLPESISSKVPFFEKG